MGKSAEKPKVQLTQGPPGLNLPNLNEARRMSPAAPKIAPLVSAAPASTIEPSATAPAPVMEDNWPMEVIKPKNRVGTVGEDLLSRNFNWGVPIVSLPGRAGMDLNLGLSLNSLIWTKSGTNMHFDLGKGFPSPGFRLGLPEIGTAFYNTETGTGSMLVTMPSGAIYEFRENPALGSNVYEEMSGTRMLLVVKPHLFYHLTTWTLLLTDGTAYKFKIITNNPKCIEIKDRNGNFISVSYTTSEQIDIITETLGREVKFSYDGSNRLTSITQNWSGATHTYATFAYSNVTIQTNFPGLDLVGASNGTTISALSRMDMADGKVYAFEYNTYGQVKNINCLAPNSASPGSFPGDYTLLSSISYDLTPDAGAPQTDCPRFFSRIDSAKDWSSGVITTYAGDGSTWGSATLPDGTVYKEFFGASGWQRGLTLRTETWLGGSLKKSITSTWANGSPNVSYWLNPQVEETNISDGSNQKRAELDYDNFGSVTDIREYDFPNTSAVLRHTQFEYLRGTAYTGNTTRRLTQLVKSQKVYDGSGALVSKITYEHDLADPQYLVHQGPPVRHDTAKFGPTFFHRGNPNVIRRWDVTDVTTQDDINKSVASTIGYNTSGSVIFSRDQLNHQTSLSYTDSFSDSVNRNTLAYVTTTTDADNFSSTFKYNYDSGAVTRAQNPKGAAVVNTYDPIGRLSEVRNQVNGAYTRYVYAPNHLSVQSFTTVNDLSSEFYKITVVDGHGRMRGVASHHPGSVGGYKAQSYEYDDRGRMVRQSNWTEIDINWEPVGDDAAGRAWTTRAYDWQGRSTVTTNQDGTTKEFLYDGCGCAGGQVVVARDEDGRRQKLSYDILGRPKTTQILFIQPKHEPLNGNGAVYSTATNTYNVRDQVTNVNVKDEATGVSQNTQMVYDGHGRLKERWLPIYLGNPQSATPYDSYEYYNDGTLKKSTDPRGASATYSYNNRRLVTSIVYGAPGGVAATPTVTLGYDEVGKRVWMDDGPGYISYVYDTLSRMESETRAFDGLPGSYKLAYEYNLVGQMKRLGYESSARPADNDNIYYAYNKAGELTAVTGSPFAGVTQYQTEMKYRAWGSLKSASYGNGVTLSASYTARQQLQQFEVAKAGSPAIHSMKAEYSYYNDGHIKYAKDLVDDKFDRAYSYDHVGRLQEAYSGTQARDFVNQTNTASVLAPYRQSYQRNVWNNLTSSNGKFWEQDYTTSATYTNGRDQGFVYDTAGNLAAEGMNSLDYDAAGRNISVSGIDFTNSSNSTESTQAIDGDGMVVKQVHNEYISYQLSSTSSSYHLHSTVLGGQVIVEINGNNIPGEYPLGGKMVGHVYAGNTEVAKHQVYFAPEIYPPQVFWSHTNPGTGSRASSANNANFFNHFEPDPSGGNVGRLPWAEAPPTADSSDMTILVVDELGQGTLNSPKYLLDGIEVPWRIAGSLINMGAAAVAPQETVRRGSNGEFEFWRAFANGTEGWAPFGAVASGRAWILPGKFGPGSEGRLDASADKTDLGGREQTSSTPGQKDLPSLINETRDIIKNATGPCAELLGKDAMEKFDEIKDNIQFNDDILVDTMGPDGRLRSVKLSHVSFISAVRNGDNIYLNRGGFAFGTFYNFPALPKHFAEAGASSQREYALATIIHEFLHTTGRFKPDSKVEIGADGVVKIDSKQSLANTKEVLKKCFPKK